MSKIKVNDEDLKQFASIIGKVEDKCREAIRHLNVDLTSLLSNIPGVSTKRIQDIEATYKQVIHKYREKLDYAQQLVKKTEAAMNQAEKNLAMKAGEFGLEMLGYYDAQRIFSEYDPITGEKVSVGDRLLATGMLALSLFPPAKVVGVGGKVAVKGVNAGTKFGLSAFAKNLPTFYSMKNVLNTKKVLEVFKGIYKEVVKAPLAATELWMERTVRQIVDFRLPVINPQVVTTIGAIPSKTIGEAFGGTKDFFVKMTRGEADNRSVWRDTKVTDKSVHKVNYGDHYTRNGRKKVLKPDVEYTSKEGYNYKTDCQGRISSAEGTLKFGDGKRNKYAQKVVGRENRLPDDEGGHLIANIFKGSGGLDNLVPMNGNLNKGEWKKLENTWTDALKLGDDVKVKITPNYMEDSQRPISFDIKYKIGDDEWEIRRFDNVPGGKKDE
ncbi:DNA/RNA non-specific endonuclease [Bacillus sp. 1NLA3E]|uniref:DNA/RNA non-specific endonuclease n=1 Tax=Bacillus sp. 1NLA3E TaxID=666686 RepID=UPI000247F499|nr:DNA/RNA non-specific endonuclease [Bacillus sp. 1NLA3E]AGK54515.1 hypothetical protein B1NLA3E_13835 [Bacillus sp. 1NLA3E]